MARLEVSCEDFSLVFTAPKYEETWKRAKGRIVREGSLVSIYEVAGAAPSITIVPDAQPAGHEGEEVEPIDIAKDPRAFFFDNVDYDVWLEVLDGCDSPAVVDDAAAVEQSFSLHRGRVLTGQINFKNDIGRADFRFRYRKDGEPRSVVLTFEVLSSKLDYHEDWRKILWDIEKKYPLLAADYLKRTYHAFDRTPLVEGSTPDLIWWNLFKEERKKFLGACRLIVQRPRRRLVPEEEWRRADRLRRLTPALENEFTEWKSAPSHLYRVEREDMSHDTPENRFVKHALGFVLHHHRKIREKIEKSYWKSLSEGEKAAIIGVEEELNRLRSHPFFRDVGRFTGLRQESSVLQRAPGYSTVWRSFGILNASYLLYEGVRRLETKNIADLYEIWCFLKIEDIVRACCEERFGAEGADFDVEDNYRVLDERFVQKLDEGEESSVVFSRNGVELAKLVYNLRIPFEGVNASGDRISTPTSLKSNNKDRKPEGQKPDIVLRLTKGPDGSDGFRLTYLFDAKYRLNDSPDADGVDWPLQENLNQMHRYRDAIYYGGKAGSAPRTDKLKKEVVGGYVLFPGGGEIPPRPPKKGMHDGRPRFLKSIDDVNIGAFPLRPGNRANLDLLKTFIGKLLDKDADQEVLETFSHKGTELRLEGETTAETLRKAVVFVPAYNGKQQPNGFRKGTIEAIKGTGICPVPAVEGICSNPGPVRMIVFTSVAGQTHFFVKPGGTPSEKTSKADADEQCKAFVEAFAKHAKPDEDGSLPDPLPAAEYWVFDVAKPTAQPAVPVA